MLQYLHKDLVKIVYKYLYFENVVKYIKYCVEPVQSSDLHRHTKLNVWNGSYSTLTNNKCKLHAPFQVSEPVNYSHIHSLIDQINGSTRTSNKHFVWKRVPHNNGACGKLLMCQDNTGRWSSSFNEGDHTYSIINGNVFRTIRSKCLEVNKLILVPFFKSNFCWQDIGQRFSRC